MVLDWPSGITLPAAADLKFLEDFRTVILAGLGSKTPFRQVSAEKLRNNVFTIMCTRMDPRFHRLNWKRGKETCPQPSHEILVESRQRIIDIAVKFARGEIRCHSLIVACANHLCCFAGDNVTASMATNLGRSGDGSTATGVAAPRDDLCEMNPAMAGIQSEVDVVSVPSEVSLEERIAIQYDNYVATPFPAATSTSCPLRWWRDTGSLLYPLLAPVARMCLAVLATSAPVERVFSRAKFWTRDERGGTGDDLVSECTSLGVQFSQPGFDLTALFSDIVPQLGDVPVVQPDVSDTGVFSV